MKLGKASYGGGNKRTYFKIKDGDNTYRILPPMGDLADKGIWSVFYNVHYGYKNSAGKLRPFQSPLVKNYKTKMIDVPDAALERIEGLKAQLEAAKKSGNTAMVQKLNEFVGPKGSFNLDNNHYVNAIDTQGNIGILKLRHRAKVALDAEIKRLREKGVDPLSVENGRFFTIRRTGMGLDTTFNVNVTSETISVQGVGQVQKEIVHSLDESIISRLQNEAGDLSKLFKKPTADEVRRIVAEGASAVDEILDAKAATGGGTTDDGSGDYDDSSEYTDTGSSAQSAGPSTASAAGVTQVLANPTSVINTPPVTTASVAQSVTPVKTEVTAAPVASTPTPTAAPVNEQSDAEFLKSLGL